MRVYILLVLSVLAVLSSANNFKKELLEDDGCLSDCGIMVFSWYFIKILILLMKKIF